MDSTARARLSDDLRKLADGDRSAFDPAYAALWPIVRSFCRRVLSSFPEGDAEDAAQHALLKVFDRASSFDPARDALTWVLSIAAWECRTSRKRHMRAREVDLDHDLVASRADDAATPEQRVVEAELEAAAMEVLGTLSAVDRETLRLTIIDESPDALTAGATFRKRRERALTRLREAWRRVYGS